MASDWNFYFSYGGKQGILFYLGTIIFWMLFSIQHNKYGFSKRVSEIKKMAVSGNKYWDMHLWDWYDFIMAIYRKSIKCTGDRTG